MNPNPEEGGCPPTDNRAPDTAIPKPELPAGSKSRWAVLCMCLFLAAVTLAVFLPTTGYEFVNYSDPLNVYENPVVTGGLTQKGVAAAFTGSESGNWIPLTILSHITDWQFHGAGAGGHHLTNVLLHTASVILLFLVLRGMTGTLWRAAFVAAVFAIHPLRVESVAWITERKDVLSGLFFMLALWAYQKYKLQTPSAIAKTVTDKKRKGWYWLVFVFFALGLMSKAMLVTLPFVLLLLDYWPLEKNPDCKLQTANWKRLVIGKIPLIALIPAASVATILAQNHIHAIQTVEDFPMFLRAENAVVSCVIYMGQMFYPARLAVYYPHPSAGLPLLEVVAAFLLLAGISAWVFICRRTRPYLIVGWLWYLGMLTPVIGILQVGSQAHADRYTYLPQIGLYIMLAWGAVELSARWRHGRTLLGGAAAILIGALAFCARSQVGYWKNSETLWLRTIACTTDNAPALNNLGNTYLQEGRGDEAMVQYEKALKIAPDDFRSQRNLGTVLLQKKRLDEALPHFAKAAELAPDDPNVHDSFGDALLQKGRLDEALAQFQQAVELKPDDPRARDDLGGVFLRKGELDEAIAQFQKVAEITPGDPGVRYNLGGALLRKGDIDSAITQLQKAVELRPDHPRALDKLGNALLQKGRADEATDCFQKLAKLTPNDPQPLYNLGDAYLQSGKVAGAVEPYQRAFALDPNYVSEHPAIQNNLAYIAWMLATSPDASARNGAKALEIALQTDKISNGSNPLVIGALAAGYAETGRFTEAIAAAQRALREAAAQNNTELADTLQKQLKSYQEGSPFRQPPQ